MLRRSAGRAHRVIRVGDVVKTERVFTAADVETYGRLVGDTNPIHFDDAAAKAQGFPKGRIVHGMLVGSVFSEMMGMRLPGKDTIYMSQSFKFTAPVYLNEEIHFTVRMESFDAVKGDMVMETLARRASDGRIVIKGQAKGRNTMVTFDEASQASTAPRND